MARRDTEVDAYVFMHLLDPGTDIPTVVQNFEKSHPFGKPFDKRRQRFGVRWAQHVVGSYVVFGAVTAPSLRALQRWITDDFWKAGVRSEWSVADRPSLWGAPYRHSPPYYAFIRVRARGNPRKVLRALDERMRHKIDPLIEEYGLDNQYQEGGWRDHFDYRAATVSGKGFDVLIEMAAESREELIDTIFEYVGTTDGVVSTDTAFAVIDAKDDQQKFAEEAGSKKSTAKRTTVTRTAAKRAPAKRAPAKRSTAKRSTAKRGARKR
jgi:hypothetical protein